MIYDLYSRLVLWLIRPALEADAVHKALMGKHATKRKFTKTSEWFDSLL